jgi:hypothetical protein
MAIFVEVTQELSFGPFFSRKFFAGLVFGTALLLGSLTGSQVASADVLAPNVDTGGAGGGSVTVSIAPTQNQQSIAMVESKEATVGVALSQNQTSIALIESKEGPAGTVTDAVDPEASALGATAFSTGGSVSICTTCFTVT